MRDVNRLLRACIKSLDLTKEIYRFSKIGNSVLELYHAQQNSEIVYEKLIMKNADVLLDFEPGKAPTYGSHSKMKENTVKRLTNLCVRQGTFVLLKKCILTGHTPEICEAVEQALSARLELTANAANLVTNNHPDHIDVDMAPEFDLQSSSAAQAPAL
jgi:hypothetical protein